MSSGLSLSDLSLARIKQSLHAPSEYPKDEELPA